MSNIIYSDQQENISIYIKQGSKKLITYIIGIPETVDHLKITKTLKKLYNCNGVFIDDDEDGLIIQLIGDHRKNVFDFLIKEGIAKSSNIKIHDLY